MSLDASIISLVLNKPDRLIKVLESNVTIDSFSDDYKPIWNYMMRMKKRHGELPSKALMSARYPDIVWPAVRERDIPILVHQLKERRRMNEFLAMMLNASRTLSDPEDLPDVMAMLQGGINQLQMQDGQDSHLINILSSDFHDRILSEIRRRRKTVAQGIKTGLSTFDHLTGGLQRKHLVVVIARTGVGKSWCSLFMVAEAIRQGKRVIFYPLEMSVEETAFRLYTIFSQRMFNGSKTLRNLDLSKGRVNKQRFMQLLSILNDQYGGRLLVADVGALTESYTLERMEAEVEVHQPDMFWVDYLTLMKSPEKRTEIWQTVSALSKGIKGIAQRHDTVVGCNAQVSREHLKSRSLCPRLEHISFGDAIGHDANEVFSLHQQGSKLYYALVKNTFGPEIEKVACRFLVNEGIIEEEHESLDTVG